ncbi:XRE family transcriptional regulator [Streptomyces sp. CBMA123]|uniref:XRE family transcriptional regulator n=1 Tax=Streptomyces sp. CBMA123 TaxID=1896313 RepID=UPI001661980B|nr:XRE family transcriptional regulator [Streptomyces sp. CBMA123]MBD0692693.1 XRE family transcriptional regulator [Streptomyces sp. CBMA123]
MNERLRSTLAQRGVPPETLATVCEVDPKTVTRWLSGRVPHARHRWSVAHHLKVDETFLWPETRPRNGQEPGQSAGLVATYPDRASVPREMWLSLLLEAKQCINVLVFSGTFFAQSNPRIATMLAQRAAAGARVRLCFGDPQGHAVAIRGREEGIGDALAAKVRASLTYYRPLLGTPGCEIRLHDTTLYNSLFRYDNDLLVNPHVWGQPASANPLLHLQKTPETGWFDGYATSFDAVWDSARPWTDDAEGAQSHGRQD